MITVVIINARSIEDVAAALLPQTTCRAVGYDRCYRLYHTDRPCRFGDLLADVECRTFDTKDAAVAWVEADDRQRQRLHATDATVVM